jgi:hypothetical protein
MAHEVEKSRLAWLLPVEGSDGTYVLASAGAEERAAVIEAFDSAIRLGDAEDDGRRTLTRMGQPLEPTDVVVLQTEVLDKFGMLGQVKRVFQEMGSDQVVACFGDPVSLGPVDKNDNEEAA